MIDEKSRGRQVWVFSGNRNHFPSAVFTERNLAEEWIKKNQLRGTLTAYPLDVSVYDHAIQEGWFKIKKEEHTTPDFVANFSSASQEHHHFEDEEE